VATVRETQLPGVGVRNEFTTESGEDVGVLVYHDGRREILVYDRDDPDACSTIVSLSSNDTRTLSELLGASRVTETVAAAVQQEVEGLGIEWITLPDGSFAAGTTIGDGEYRTRTGASVVAVLRGDESIPAPGPDFRFEVGDVVVATGTNDGLGRLRDIMLATR
jgi:TrkA domain protein